MSKSLKIFLIICGMINLCKAQVVDVSPSMFDFGTVAKWKNDTAYFTITNNSASKFIFLPIGYTQDVMVMVPKTTIQIGETAIVKFIYFTQNRGNFKKSVPIYMSSVSYPVYLNIKGKIIDFHPDAMLNCPSLIDDPGPSTPDKPVEISVVDAISGKGLTGFDMLIKNNLEQQLIEKANKNQVYFNNLKNGRYQVEVNLSGYETKNEEIIVNKITRKFIIKLNQDEGPLVMTEPEITKTTDDPIILKPSSDKEEEKRDIEKLREKFNEMYKDKRIIEKDVMVIKEGESDSMAKDTLPVNKSNLPDFTDNGTLNKEKYASNNIVFLIDVSTSMNLPEKLPYLKKSLTDMVKILRKEDLVTIIVYSSKVKTLIQGEPGSNKQAINQIIESLEAKGLSHGTEGMNIAYANAKQNFIRGGNNQIILVSDGIFNSENFEPKVIYKLAKQNAEIDNIKTSAIGFGKNSEAIDFMKTLTQNGLGNFIRIQTENDAALVLIHEIMQNSMKQ